ncbi:MAG TPA: RNA 3'-terminal phosphate cyclase, partial [Gammaproteobacteria bacterium]|nr:RNA 3'-terminal phosphate cyclase [Gammaproteobacteria bacterium]
MNTKSEVITIDGNTGEGGGQMLRSALTLSMITRKPLKMINIRKKRTKPGLLRQHLTALKAAQTICNAKVQGAELGATEIIFIPKEINGGDYTFDIGTAGSTSLVAQTVIPALAFADTPSTLA